MYLKNTTNATDEQFGFCTLFHLYESNVLKSATPMLHSLPQRVELGSPKQAGTLNVGKSPFRLSETPILSTCEKLLILITSRYPLRIEEEQTYRVKPLEVPSVAERQDPRQVERSPATALYIRYAGAIKNSFTLTSENAPTLAALCQLLNGLPLAIRPAAAQIELHPPEEVYRELLSGMGIKILEGSYFTDLPPRYINYQEALEWSYRLLTKPEQKLFRRFAFYLEQSFGRTSINFASREGELDIRAIHKVCSINNDLPVKNTYPLLYNLYRYQLLEAESVNRRVYFSMLFVISQYAVSKLSKKEREFVIEQIPRPPVAPLMPLSREGSA